MKLLHNLHTVHVATTSSFQEHDKLIMLLAQYCVCELYEKSLNFLKFEAFVINQLLHIMITVTID